MTDYTFSAAKSRHQREFDALKPPKGSRIQLKRATANDIPTASEFAKSELPGSIAAAPVIEAAIERNRDNVLLFCRSGEVVGVWATLMLNPLGLERLLTGELDGRNPDVATLSPGGVQPAGIYMWVVVAPRLAAEGIMHASELLRQPLYRQANLFSRPNTELGVRLNVSLGFRPIPHGAPGIYRYVRLENRPARLAEAA